MATPHDPEDFPFRPSMTAHRDHYPRGTVILPGRATASMPLRARTRHFAAKTVVKRVRPAFRGAGPSRRVFVKVKVVMRTPNARASLKACVRYFGREGAGEKGARAAFFGPHEDRPDAKAEVDRWADDRRHYRIVVNPEDGQELADVRQFARRMMKQVEIDTGTPLEWLAVAHYDTGRPHLHLILRGLRDDGRDLVFSRGYAAQGLRSRCEALATEILGPRSDRTASIRDLTADRLTAMDDTLLRRQGDGKVNLEGLESGERANALRRLVHLERRGWAQRDSQGLWTLSEDLRDILRNVGEQEAREAAATRAIWGGFWGGQTDRLEPLNLSEGEVVVGAYAGVQPLKWHKKAAQLLVLETMDGRLGHVRLASLDRVMILDRVPERAVIELRGKPWRERASDQTIAQVARLRNGVYSEADHLAVRPEDRFVFIERHLRRLETMRREGAVEPLGEGRFAIPPDYVSQASAADQARHGPADVEVRVLDVRPLHLQTAAHGVTWLDKVAGGFEPDPGVGPMADEARRLGKERAEIRKGWGIGDGDGTKLTDKDMLALWTMEIETQFKRLGKGEKLVVKAEEGQPFSGVYNDRVHMGGRTYAAVENRTVVTLAPWRAGLEACRGQGLTGVLQAGQVEFRFGERGRGLGLEL